VRYHALLWRKLRSLPVAEQVRIRAARVKGAKRSMAAFLADPEKVAKRRIAILAALGRGIHSLEGKRAATEARRMIPAESRRAIALRASKQFWGDPEFAVNREARNRRISAALKGRAKSEEHCRHLSESLRGRRPIQLEAYYRRNHRVVAVEPGPILPEVWDLEIEEHHNFALSAGVFVHNSMRILPMGEFANLGRYRVPPSVSHAQRQVGVAGGEMQLPVEAWAKFMGFVQDFYNDLLLIKIPQEEARDCLPLACLHRISWSLNLAALSKVISKRSCWILQLGLWGPVIKGMVAEVVKIDPVLHALTRPPCVKVSDGEEKCASCPFNLDNERRIAGVDPLPPCPVWRYLETGRSDYVSEQQKQAAELWSETWKRSHWTGIATELNRMQQLS